MDGKAAAAEQLTLNILLREVAHQEESARGRQRGGGGGERERDGRGGVERIIRSGRAVPGTWI